MIKNIVFDLGNVLVDFPWQKYLYDFGFPAETQERIASVLFLGTAWKEADRGVLSDEKIFQEVLKKAPDLERELKEVWERRTQIAEEYEYSYRWLQQLRLAGYHLYILSNYGRITFQKLREKSKIFSLVEGMVISYEVKHIKPEPEIYQKLVDRYSIHPEQSLYLDDLPENIEAGKKMGFRTILFSGYEDAVEKMKAFGVNISEIN